MFRERSAILQVIDEKPYDCNSDTSALSLPQRSIIAFLKEMEEFQIRMGLSPRSNAPRSEAGLYTDFS